MSTVQGGQGNIVTNGLVLNLDAANPRSYPQPYNGTAWRNLVPASSSLVGTLTNGPTFSTSGSGCIVFDGVDDYVLVNSGSSALNPTTAITVASFFNISSYTSNYAPICFKQNNYSTIYEQYSIYLSNTEMGFVVTGVDRAQKVAKSSVDYRNQLIYAVGTCDVNTDELKFYVNGTLTQTTSFTSTFDTADTPINIGGTGILKFSATYAGWANGKIYSTQIYNRALTQSEVLQNFNAQRARFGI
jgi:hypothetical protein